MARAAARFDRQAEDYDRRASLPEDVCRSAVRGLKSLAGLQPGDLVVEVGVGSGQLSRWLCREPITYIGFDVSRRMLAVCARKIRPWQGDCLLLQADGERSWPIASGMHETCVWFALHPPLDTRSRCRRGAPAHEQEGRRLRHRSGQAGPEQRPRACQVRIKTPPARGWMVSARRRGKPEFPDRKASPAWRDAPGTPGRRQLVYHDDARAGDCGLGKPTGPRRPGSGASRSRTSIWQRSGLGRRRHSGVSMPCSRPPSPMY